MHGKQAARRGGLTAAIAAVVMLAACGNDGNGAGPNDAAAGAGGVAAHAGGGTAGATPVGGASGGAAGMAGTAGMASAGATGEAGMTMIPDASPDVSGAAGSGGADGGVAGVGGADAGVGGAAAGASGGAGGAAGAASCPGEAAPCTSAGKAGICRSGACTSCVDVADDGACQSAYGSNRLCIGGACIVAACRGSGACAVGQLCKANACVACVDVTDDAACGAGKLCIGGACVAATCRSNVDCSSGQLCSNNVCTVCSDPADDGACAARYGAGFICSGGVCANGCRTPSDCGSGQLCKNNACTGCASGDDAACAARYGNTSVCNAGACSQGTCAADVGCGGATLCQGTTCAACVDGADDGRCQARYGNGVLCVGGSCVVANCRADATCSAGQLCKSNTCAACVDGTDDAACAARYGAGSICNGGTCQAGCRTDAACAAGQLCGAGNTCAACTGAADDAACAARYGAGSICNGGACVAGCRDDAGCSDGQVCHAQTLTCANCAGVGDDVTCAARYGAGSICTGGVCAAGCRSAQGCVGDDSGHLCTGLTCTACGEDASGDAACSSQYGLQSVCVAGACVPGDCRSSSDCTGANAGYRCINNQCTPCSNDAGCQGDAAYGAGTICHTAADNASGKKGQCVSSACSTARAACDANPSVDFCCASNGSNSCVAGSCCVTGDCAFGQTCSNHQCVQCNTVSDGNYYVDPVNGADAGGITGSSTCAWKSITYALAQLAGSAQAAVINVKATGNVTTSSGETFPIGVSTALPNGGGTYRIVPANRTIRGAGTDVPTVSVPQSQTAFILAKPNTRLTQLIVASANTASGSRGSYGIRVFQGSDATTTIDHVTVRDTQGAPIRVERTTASSATSGVLTIGPGVTVTGAGTSACGGLHVLGNGVVTVTGGADAEVTQFVNNNGYGVCINERGSVTMTGTAVYPVPQGQSEGTIVIKGNSSGGVSLQSCISDANEYVAINGGALPPAGFTTGNCPAGLTGLGTAPPLTTLDGVAIWSHATGTANGVYTTAGSQLKLRRSVVVGNARAGFRVDNGPTYTNASLSYRVFDLSGLDLGTSGDAGGNLLQVPWGSGSPLNGGAGIQVNITAGQGQTLRAVGNKLQDDATSGTLVDCSTTATAVSRNYPNVATCYTTSTKGISVCGNVTQTGATPNKVDVSVCTIP